MSYQRPELSDRRQRETHLSDRESLVSGHEHQRKSCHSAAVFNVVNSVIGSGIIGLPYSMNQAGFPLGLLLLFWVSYITDFSLILLIKGGALSGTDSYQSLVNKTFGFPGYLLLSALQFMYPFIAMISYNIITGDTLSKVFQRIPGVDPGSVLIGRHFIIVVSTATFTLPLSLYRDIAKLGKISFISTVLTTIILGIVITRAVSLGPNVDTLCLSSRRKQDENRGHVCSFLLCGHLSAERATQTWGSGWNCQIIAQQLGESVCLPALVGSSCGLTEQESKNRLEAMQVSREKYLRARQSFLG